MTKRIRVSDGITSVTFGDADASHSYRVADGQLVDCDRFEQAAAAGLAVEDAGLEDDLPDWQAELAAATAADAAQRLAADEAAAAAAAAAATTAATSPKGKRPAADDPAA